MKKEEFVLPEKWVVRDCKYVTRYHNKTFNKCSDVDTSIYFHQYIDDDNELTCVWLREDEVNGEEYKEITLLQFKKYVVKEKVDISIPISRKENTNYLIPFINKINQQWKKEYGKQVLI